MFMRMLALLTGATALAACNQSQPAAESPPAAEVPNAQFEARVNIAKVDPAKAKAVMHERHEGMEKIGKLMKQLSRDIKVEPLNLAAIAPVAASMQVLAEKSGDWFPAGTGPNVGKTQAKAEIWQKPQDFAAKTAAFQKAAGAFQAAASKGNAAATKAAFGDLGKSCKACHDSYRSKDKY